MPAEDAAVKAKAEGILKRAQAGEDFAKLAKDFSQDPGSAAQGGDLGWSERKAWVAPFAEAAFSMKVDEIRGPVKTQFGYHILKLAGIQPATVKTFEQSKADMETEYRRNEAEKLFNNAQDQLADAALQNNADIDVVARKAGLTVVQIPVFSRIDGGGALGKVPAVVEAAFSQDVLDGRLSPMVEVEKGRGVVLRATDHKLPQQRPFEEVRTELTAAWKKQRGGELAMAAAEDAVKRLTAGETWDAVAKSAGLAVTAPKFIGARRPRSAARDPLNGVRPAQAGGQADLRRRQLCQRRRGGHRVKRRARGAGRSETAGSGDAPAVCGASRLERGAELCRGCARRCQGRHQSAGNRLVV